MTTVELLSFSMRTTPPQPGEDWFRIVDKKKDDEPVKVYIYDEIGFWGTNAKDFAALFNEIDAKEIHLHINSPGGSVFDGLAIGAAVRDHSAKVIGKVDGMAASIASVILQYCDEREISRNASVMVHDAKGYAGGNEHQMRAAADLLGRVSDNIADVYAVRTGQGTAKSWRATMKSGDIWYSGNEALASGLVDAVVDNPEEEPEDIANEWDKDAVEAFILAPAAALAKDPKRSIITNRVEEALMTGANPSTPTPPPAAPQPPAPAAQAQVDPPQAPAAPAPAPAAQADVKFMVNGVEVTDFAAVQAHIDALQTFKNETIESSRKDFVKKLATDNKILANAETLTATETFALSLSNEQFAAWKATMEAAPANSLLQPHGASGNSTAPQNGGGVDDLDNQIVIQQEIVDSHIAGGMSQESLENKASYKELQRLKALKAGSS
jgi:ATP-dependent protease ClpP protease subunit